MSTDAGRQHEMQLAINELISTLLDSQKGFADIGEHLEDETLKRYFLAESLKRASFRGRVPGDPSPERRARYQGIRHSHRLLPSRVGRPELSWVAATTPSLDRRTG